MSIECDIDNIHILALGTDFHKNYVHVTQRDGIQAELLMVDPKILAKVLHSHICAAWHNETIPPTWLKSALLTKKTRFAS